MTVVRRLLLIVVFAVSIAAGSAFASASNIYITQNGSPSGNCKSNVQTLAFFNNASNWGSGSNQIGPGTTVLLCGTFTFTKGSSGLNVMGSGSSGNPVLVQFDTGATLQSPAFSGFGSGGAAIVINGVNYVVIDGQNAGVVENTLNGSPSQTTCLGGNCTVQQSSTGIYIHETTGVEIRDLVIQNIYMDLKAEQSGGGSGAAWNTADVYTDGPNTALTIDGNVLKDAHVGAWISFDNGSTSANIYGNTIAHHGWQISAANGNSCTNTMSINIFGNDISDWNDWNAGGSGSYHTDGIIEYTRSTGCTAPSFNPQIYDNYFHGDLDGGTGAGTAHIYCSNDTGGSTSFPNSTCTAFNNIVDMSAGGNTNCAAAIWMAGQSASVYNNTLIAPTSCSKGSSYGIVFGASTKTTLQNNILVNFNHFYGDPGPYGNVATEISVSNNNDFYNCTSGGNCWAFGQGNWATLAAWSSAVSVDTNSTNANPNLTSSYAIGAGSSVLGVAANLDAVLGISASSGSIPLAEANIGIQALAYDKSLISRPPADNGNWNPGSLENAPNTPNPPSGLIASVN
jgi:hypothetical protein